MASSASTRLGLRKQGTGDNEDTWGSELNEDVIDLIDEAAAGVETIALTGNVTLSSTNYVTNQARNIALRLTDSSLTAAPTITVAAKEKVYVVDNTTSYVVTFSSGGTDATVPAQRKAVVYCDGTDVYSEKLFQAEDLASYGGGLEYTFDTTTTDADPGSGKLRLDHATPASATGIYMDDAEANGTDVSALLATWDDSTSTVKGFIKIQSKDAPATFHVYSVTSLTDNAGYMDFTVAYVDGAGSFSNSDEVVVSFSRTGDTKPPGGVFEYAFSTTTTDSDPGSGILRLDNATASSATGIYVDDAETNGVDVSVSLLTWDDSTSTIKGDVTIQSKETPSKFRRYSLTSLTDNTGYVDFTVTHLTGNGSFTDGEAVYLSFAPKGDKGDTGTTGATGDIGDILAQTTETTVAMGDWAIIHDLSAGATRKITVANLLGSTAITSMTVTALTATTATVTDLTVSDKSDLRGVVQTAVAGQSKRTADESVDASADTDLTVDGAQVQYLKLTGDHTVNVFGGEADSNGAYAANGWVLEVEQDATGSRNLTIQKGNRLTYSKDPQSTAEAGETRPWTDNNTSLDDNAAVGPDGQTTLTKLIADATTSTHDRGQTLTGLAPSQTLTGSVEVRDAGDSLNIKVYLDDPDATTNFVVATVNPSTGAVVTSPINGGNASGGTLTVTSLQNSCYRIDLTGQVNTSGTRTRMRVRLMSGTTDSFLGDGAGGVYIGNIQVNPGNPVGMIKVGASRALDGWIGTEVDFSAQAAGTKTSVAVEGPEIDGYLVAAARERS